MNNNFVTVINFECKDCGTKIGQLVANGGVDPDNITCLYCRSDNVTFSTVFK